MKRAAEALRRALFRRARIDAELAEELRSHLEMRAEMNRQHGMTPAEAQAAAHRQFGSATLIQEEARRMHVNEFLESAAQDLRYAFRSFLRSPAFVLSATLALALGIGASTAVFSAVDRILFRSLPYPAPDRLVSIGIMTPLESTELMFSASYVDWQKAQAPFEGMTSWNGVVDCDLTDSDPVRLGCAQVESNFLPIFGIQPILGRSFTPEEDVPNAPMVALLTYGLWQSRFAASRNIVGATISLNGSPARIVGVLPGGFELPGLNRADLVTPSRLNRTFAPGATGRDIRAFARLKAGVSISQAHAALEPLFAQFLPTVPAPFRKQVWLRVRSLRDLQTQDSRLASWLLLGAVAALLVLACANVANLMLARAARRQSEFAVRAAIGATRGRLFRQALTESALLALMGAAAGCAVAFALLRIFVAIAPAGILRLEQARLDGRVLLFTLAVMALSGVLFGIVPALEIPRCDALTGSRIAGSGRSVFRHVLVSAQIAISIVLLSGATLLLRSLWNLENAPLGFEGGQVIAASFVLSPHSYAAAQRQQAFFEELESRAAQIPGVSAAAISDSIPPSGRVRSRPYTSLQAEGHPRYTQDSGGMIAWRFVTPGYFAALRVPILRGRGFIEQDRDADRAALVLSQSLARRLFPGEDAAGKRVSFGAGEPWYTVAGVAADVKNAGLTERPDPEYYLVRRHGSDPVYAAQVMPFGWRAASVVVRTSLDAHATAESLRSIVTALDPTVPVTVETMGQHTGGLAQRPRFNAILLTIFAAMGLLLAAIGLYGVMAFLVAQRTREIGVRMALGASSGAIARMVLTNAVRWTGVGAALGIAGSLFAERALGSMLFGIPPHDPATLACAVAILGAVAAIAAWLPARQASAVDPMAALRAE